jgi:ABC-type phosphate/phosphonate transport system permease subunit
VFGRTVPVLVLAVLLAAVLGLGAPAGATELILDTQEFAPFN